MSDKGSSKPGNAVGRHPPAVASRARLPTQERAQQRVELALKVAERMLLRLGPEATSIPEIAKQSGVPRASLYQFFPDKYALFAHLAQRHLSQVAAAVAAAGKHARARTWHTLIPLLVDAAADYYNATPVASLLVLGGPFSRSAYLAQEVTIENIGHAVRGSFARLAPTLKLPADPDAATLCVEIAFACLKYGYYREGNISKKTRAEAVRATVAYLAAWGNKLPAR